MTDPSFHERREHELAELSDDDLIDYIRTARGAGRADSMRLALGILVFAYLEIVSRRVALKVAGGDVDDVAQDALASALTSAFNGESVGEFRSWLHTITDRRVADHWRRMQRRPVTQPLPTGGEDGWGEEPAAEFEGVTVDLERAIAHGFAALGETHRAIVEGYVFGDRPASEVAAEHGTSEQNVHQVGSRFRRRVREALEADGDTPGRDG